MPDLWLVFAPVKKTPADYLAQKATELGVARLQPVFTRRTIVTRVNEERLAANAIEAAEQSDRLSVPEIGAPLALEKLLAAWPKERTLYFCDEGGDAKAAGAGAREGHGARRHPHRPGRRLRSGRARACCAAMPFVTPVTLGPRILRADTAALAALAIWQSVAGDWR